MSKSEIAIDVQVSMKDKVPGARPFPIDLPKILVEVELFYIHLALACSRNCISEAAKTLGIQRTCLTMKLKKYGIVIPVKA